MDTPSMEAGPSEPPPFGEESNRSSHEVRWPLLTTGSSLDFSEAGQEAGGSSTQWQTTMNLCKSMLGAAVLTLPFSGAQLGWITSIVLLVGVAAATHLTLLTIAKASDACAPLTARTYAQLAAYRISPRAGDLLQACLLANVWGISVVYLQVVVDALIGQTSDHPHHSHHSLAAYASDALSAASRALAGSALPAQGDGGLADSGLSASMGLPDPARALLQEFEPSSAGELPGLGLQARGACEGLLCPLLPCLPPLLGTRGALLCFLTVFLLMPLTHLRTMSRTAVVSMAGVLSMLALTGTVVALAGLGAAQGTLHPLPAWPQDARPDATLFSQLMHVLTVAPALLSAFTCQQNLHSVKASLHAYTLPRMRMAIVHACLAAALLYTLLTLSGMALFGSGARGDMLHNLGAHSLVSYGCPPRLAVVIAAGLQVSMVLSMLGSYCVMMWPLRTAVSEVVHGTPDPSPHQFNLITLALVVSTATTAALVQDVEFAVQLIGATAANAIAFFFPAVLLLWPRRSFGELASEPTRKEVVLGYSLLTASCVIFVGGLVNALS